MKRILLVLAMLFAVAVHARAQVAATITANVTAPTGVTAQASAFGLAAYTGSNNFGTMTQSGWQSSYTSLPGVGMFRSNPNSLISVWPTRASWTGNSPTWSGYNSFWLGLKAINFTGPVVVGMGITLPAWPDGAMNSASSSDAAIFGQMAVKIAQRMQSDGYTNANIYFEGTNEPDGNGYSAANAAMYSNAVATALKAAGFSYPVGAPVIANQPNSTRAAYVTDAASTMGTANLGFLDYHFYGVGTSDNGCFVANDANIRIANALGVGTLGTTYGYASFNATMRSLAAAVNSGLANLPVFLGEYNLYGEYVADPSCPNSGQSDFQQQTSAAAVFSAAIMIDSLTNAASGSSLQMGAMWHAYEDLPGLGETYGVINGATVDNNSGNNYPAWHIYPAAYAVSYMYKNMPGSVVNTTVSSSAIPVAAMTTVNAGAGTLGMMIINYSNTTSYNVNVAISSNPSTATYYEISGNCNYTSFATWQSSCQSTKTAAQLANLAIPPMAVVILGASSSSSTVTASRAADFANIWSVDIGLSGGGSNELNAAQFLTDLQYLNLKHVRDGLNINLSGSSLTSFTTLVNNGVTFVAEVPYPNSGTTTPAAQIAQAHAWQAINANAIYANEGINEPGLFYPTANYGTNGYTSNSACTGSGGGYGGGSCSWAPVADYTSAWVTALLADNALKSIPIYAPSKPGQEPSDVGMQFLTVQGGHSSYPNGTVFGQYLNNHVYPQDQQFLHSPGILGACQTVDSNAGNSFGIQMTYDNVTTQVGNFSGYANLATAQLNPHVVTEFGYHTSSSGSTTNINEDKKGRCILSAMINAWNYGESIISIYNMYDYSGDGFGLFTTGGSPALSGQYFHNFTSVLVDTGSTARTFTPGTLGYNLSGTNANMLTKLFQKSNGDYIFEIWDSTSDWNFTSSQPITIGPTNVTFSLPGGQSATLSQYDPVLGSAAQQTITGSSITFPVSDYPQQIVVHLLGVSANDSYIVASGPALTDSSGNNWTITATAQLALNGTTLAGTSNVVEVAYVSSTIWAQNTSGNWYSYNSSGATVSGPTTNPLPGFSVKNGNIIAPNGTIFNSAGINVLDYQMGTASSNSSGQPLTNLFAGITEIRLNSGCGPGCGTTTATYPALSSYTTFVQQLTGYDPVGSTWVPRVGANHVVVEIEDHDSNMGQNPFTGAVLAVQTGWYQTLAAAFINNPYVWFGSQNEMGSASYSTSDIAAGSASNVAFYNAVRGTGNNTILQIGAGVGGSNIGTVGANAGWVVADYSTMHNIVWELHCYYSNGDSNGSLYNTAAGYVQGGLSAPSSGAQGGWGIAAAHTINSADGVVPIIIGEWGSDSGEVSGADATQITAEVTSVLTTQGVGNTAWSWWANGSNGAGWDAVTNGYCGYSCGTIALTQWGQMIANVIAAIPAQAGPAWQAPGSLTATQSSSNAVSGLSVSDAAYPSDTMSFTGSSTLSGKLTATGATGNGTSTVTFIGGLSALNTLLGTMSFTDSVVESPTLNWSVTDAHSNTATAQTAVTNSGAVSPSCSFTTTVGVILTSAGPPVATWAIDTNGQIKVNGVDDTTTANVVELAYVNGLIWQLNTSGNWYDKGTPAATWGGPTTTNPLTAASCGPVFTVPSSVSAQASAATAISGVSVADAAYPSDTQTFTGTATGNGTLTATGATGNGSSRITFSGSIAATNTMLGTLSFSDGTVQTSTVTLQSTDAHNLSGSATIPVTVTSGMSPNCTVVTTKLTPVIVSAGPPSATWAIDNNGEVLVNGTDDSTTSNVSELAYVSGNVWRLSSTASAIISATPTGQTLTDATGGVWTIVSGEAYLNGSPPAFSANVIELALVSGTVYQENSSSQWYYFTAPSTWTAVYTNPVSGNWYDKATPAAAWAGPVTSSPLTGCGSTSNSYPIIIGMP